MDEQNNVQENVNVSPEAGHDSTSTAQPQESTSLPATEVHDDEQNGSEVSHDDTKGQEDVRAQSKMSKLEKENYEYQRALQEAQRYTEAQRAWVLKSEARTREYLKDSGMEDNEIESAINEFKTQRPELWASKTKSSNQTPTPPLDVNTVRRAVREEITRENNAKLQQETYNRFFQAVPEMDPARVNPNNKAEAAVVAQAVENLAMVNAATQGLQIPTAEMYIDAYRKVRPSRDIEQARKEGEIEGMAKVNASNASTFGQPANSQAPRPNINLTDAERAIAEKWGIKPEDYAKQKQGY